MLINSSASKINTSIYIKVFLFPKSKAKLVVILSIRIRIRESLMHEDSVKENKVEGYSGKHRKQFRNFSISLKFSIRQHFLIMNIYTKTKEMGK